MHPLIGLRMLPTLWRHKGFTDRAVEATSTFDKELGGWLVKYLLPVLDQKRPIQPFSMARPMQEAGWPYGTGVILNR